MTIDSLPAVVLEVGLTGPSTAKYLHLDDEVRGLLGTAELAPTDLLTDISSYVVTAGLHTRRGSTRVEGPLVRYQAGMATIMLDNSDRRFDPTNLNGPYVSGGRTQVEPMRVVQIRAVWDGIGYTLWRGFSDDWQATYFPGNSYSLTALTATDGFKVLQSNDRAAGSSVGAGEDSGARVSRILDSADWPSKDRIVATGDTTVQATTLEGEALGELFTVVDTEIGEGYVDGSGRYVFRNRHALQTDDRSATSQATFGDGGGSELAFDDVVLGSLSEQLFNVARVTRDGGSEQTITDTDSVTRYLTHTFRSSGLLMQTDAVAADYGRHVVAQSKDPEVTFDELVIKPQGDPDNLYPQVLGREIGDRITVKYTPPGGGDRIERDALIRGIEHGVTDEGEWVTTWVLQSALKQAFLTLDNATLGKLDENALAY